MNTTIGLLLWLFSEMAYAERVASWMPDANSYAAAAQSQECGAFRSLKQKAKAQLEEARRGLKEATAELKTRRQALEGCAKEKGLAPETRPSDYALAQACPEAYEFWLAPSYRAHMFLQDLESATQALGEINTHMQSDCPIPRGLTQGNVF